MRALALLLFLTPAAESAVSSGTVRLVAVEDMVTYTWKNGGEPLARLVSLNPSSAAILASDYVLCERSGTDRRLEAEDGAGPTEAAVLESSYQDVIVYPAPSDFVAAYAALSRDPASYKDPWSVSYSSRAAVLVPERDGEGRSWLTTRPGPGGRPWRKASTLRYRVRWGGRELSVAVMSREFGGVNRLAAALKEERGPFVGVARGGVIFSNIPAYADLRLLDALEKAGLKYSAVMGSDILAWDRLERYRLLRPDGVQFLSANVVYSSAPTRTLLPPYALVESGGLRVALIGLTYGAAAGRLGQAGLTHARLLPPGEVLPKLVAELRPRADAIVVLSILDGEMERVLRATRGVDLVLGHEPALHAGTRPPELDLRQEDRPPYAEPHVASVYSMSLNAFTLSVSRGPAGRGWRLRQDVRLLDDSVAGAPGLPDYDPAVFGTAASSGPVLLPPARDVVSHPEEPNPAYRAREFWTLAAALLARDTGSEVSFMRVRGLGLQITAPLREAGVRNWLLFSTEEVVRLSLRGHELVPLLERAAAQRAEDDPSESGAGRLRLTAGGLGPDRKIHGMAIEAGAAYRAAMTRELAESLGLLPGRPAEPVGPLDRLVLAALRERAGTPPAEVRSWVEGRPAGTRGLWRVNFRDVGLTVRDTKVVRDDAFDAVPNSRVQGFNEFLIGAVAKTDVDYVTDSFRWSNTGEAEYARSRLQPRGQPTVINTTANRIKALTIGTLRAGSFSDDGRWLASSWGPALGFQYDGEFEASPGLRRRNIYNVFPGVQFYDGSWIRSMEWSGNVKRDLSRDPPNTQTGLHTRWLLSHELPGGATLAGDLFADYFFLTKRDLPQDLRLEGNANLKLRFPIRRHFTIAPFIDYYFFMLKTRPLSGYSAMMGVQLGFSRLWKPQYEAF